MIIILTRTPVIFSIEYIKHVLKKISGKKRGPEAVVQSLTTGLNTLGISFKLNPFFVSKSDTVHILSGIEALSWAIKKKEKGYFKKLIIGPNVSVAPDEYQNLSSNKLIDIILQPAEWPLNFWKSINPALAEKMFIWPAGVDVPQKTPESSLKKHCLIYDKIKDQSLLQEIITTLDTLGISYSLLTYGTFRQKDYYAELSACSFVIYLSKSESQGLALQEAWARNVPTFVLRNTTWKYKQYSWSDTKINAPYLTDTMGAFFENPQDLTRVVKTLTDTPYNSRDYVLEHLTHEKSATLYMQIINKNTSEK